MTEMASEKSDAPPRADVDIAVESLLKRLQEARFTEADLKARLKALTESLVAAGAVVPEEIERRRRAELSRELLRLKEHPLYKLSTDNPDKYALESLPEIDCAAILPICRARCCSLTVTLTKQDLDERKLHWNYAEPYVLQRRESDDRCVHCDEATGGCGAYEYRPSMCRVYDCRDDNRIWLDFDKRVLAP